MTKLVRKSNVFHPLINGVSFTQSQCGTFSVSGEVTDEQAAVFLQVPDVYEAVGERAPGDQPPATPRKPESKKDREAREKAEREAAKAAEEAAKKVADDAAKAAEAAADNGAPPDVTDAGNAGDSDTGGDDSNPEDSVF
jgi:hypothetical protein